MTDHGGGIGSRWNDRTLTLLHRFDRKPRAVRQSLKTRDIREATREDGRNVVAKLLADAQERGPKGQNTAVNLLGRFKTLLNQAVDLEWLPKNPLQGRTIERKKATRMPWVNTDLVIAVRRSDLYALRASQGLYGGR